MRGEGGFDAMTGRTRETLVIDLKQPERLQLLAASLLCVCTGVLLGSEAGRQWLGFAEPPSIRLGSFAIAMIYLVIIGALGLFSILVATGARSAAVQIAILLISISFSVRGVRSLTEVMEGENLVHPGLMLFTFLAVAMLNISGLLALTYLKRQVSPTTSD